MAKMLFDSHPLVVDPDLAAKIGLNEAIILQQLHYWIVINRKEGKNFKEGYCWTYNSIPAWQEQFPFWSVDTIKRTLGKLRNRGLIVVANYNKMKMDKTNWYRIDYKELEKLRDKDESKKVVDSEHFRNIREDISKNENPTK